MKKLIALLLVLVMVAGLVACAGSNDETKGNDTTNTEIPPTATAIAIPAPVSPSTSA